MQEPSAVDWREVIAGKDGFLPKEPPREPREQRLRREMSFGTAFAIAAFAEAVVGTLILLILTWHHHHYPNPAQPVMHVHLVPPAMTAPLHPSKGRRHGDPSAGRRGMRAGATKAHLTTAGKGGAVATRGNSGATVAAAAFRGERAKSAHVRLDASCHSAAGGCVNPRALQRYLRRLHAVLQQRLAALVHKELPVGSGSVILRFVGNPAGGKPLEVSVVQAATNLTASRKLRAAVEGTALPGYPTGLGRKGTLSFKVALQSGGGG